MPFLRQLALLGGPCLFLLCCLLALGLDLPLEMPADSESVVLTAPALLLSGTTLWMAIWWLSGVVPIYLTALLPLVIYPLAGVATVKSIGPAYGHYLVWLLFAGFVLAAAIERWQLHRRIALSIILFTGTRPASIILGFMIATAFLSMWISNTATAVMMVPIGMAVASTLKDVQAQEAEVPTTAFPKALMLGIAYSASLGGMSSLIGTPTNPIMVSQVMDNYHLSIGFLEWSLLALPLGIILLLVAWYYLTQLAFPLSSQGGQAAKKAIEAEYRKLGPVSTAEYRVSIIFGITATLWICRRLLQTAVQAISGPDNPPIVDINDTSIGLLAVLAFFLVPSGIEDAKRPGRQSRLLSWENVESIPWGVLLLIGGGLAIAASFDTTGLGAYFGELLSQLSSWPFLLFLLLLVAGVNFLTELTSNMATVSILMPVLMALAAATGWHPFPLMAGATLAAGCAFMLPIATPPNAIVFGTGYIDIPDMARVGFWMNIISIILITLLVQFVLPLVWTLPDIQ
ncbi:MAG: DASS family sodium-coupled anion symporter [Bacteroidota bacterium]